MKDARPSRPPTSEGWFLPAYGMLAATLATYGVLAARPGGLLPLFLWRRGRDLLFLFGVLILLWSLGVALRRRPFLQPRRMRPLAALAICLFVLPFPFPYPSSHDGHPSAVAFRLPVEGEWRVHWGGEGPGANRLALFHAELRWALALVRPGGADARGTPVLAPCAGEVVVVREDLPDAGTGAGTTGVPWLGNLVVLRVADSEYCFLAHLEQGSVTVRVGDRVRPGDALARIGSSGFAKSPSSAHLLVFLQDSPREGRGEPIPWSFRAYHADGRPVERGLPRGGVAPDGRPRGQLVRHSPEAFPSAGD